jgi:hypothetical protein
MPDNSLEALMFSVDEPGLLTADAVTAAARQRGLFRPLALP